MDGLRGVAVTLVFFVHFDSLFSRLLPASSGVVRALGALGKLGFAGVDLFFVLSGFLIYAMLIRARPNPGTYLRRRAQRIYPTFLVVFLIYLALSFLVPSESKIPAGHAVSYLIANLALLPGMFAIPAMITVAWSLSYEVFFYLALPALIALFRMRAMSRAARVATIVGVAGAIVAGDALAGGSHLRVGTFAFGILAYEALGSTAFRGSVERSRGAFLVVLLALTAACSMTSADFFGLGPLGLGPALFFLAVFALGQPRGVTRVLSAMPLRWLGGISYSYYLIHGLALKAVSLVLYRLLHGHTTPLGMAAILAFSFAATLVAAQILYNFVEYPLSVAVPSSASAPAIASVAEASRPAPGTDRAALVARAAKA